MITFDVNVTGGQLGSALASDSEELAYALLTLATDTDADSEGQEIEGYLSYDERERVAKWLRTVAEKLEPEA